MRKIGVGIIGCGTIADVYLTNLTQHFEHVEVVAVADLFEEKARQAAEKYGIGKSGSVDGLLADPAVEIVLNLTIPAAHYSVNKQILEAGKHAYCEKPLALKYEEAEELASLLRGHNGHVNLIPVNPIKERDFKRSDKTRIFAFQNKLEKNGINVTIRREMGRDIDGACGQLRRKHNEEARGLDSDKGCI